MGRDQRANHEALRTGRMRALGDVAVYLSRAFLNLGPCFAVTVAFTGPGQENKNAETYSFTSWFDKNMGSAHLAELSDRLNEQHVKVQAELDQEAAGARKEGGENVS